MMKMILCDVMGSVRLGEVLVFMGLMGSGKMLLLNVLVGWMLLGGML